MSGVPVDKLNEVLDMYREVALDPRCSEFWLAIATLVGVYEEEA